MIKSFKRLVVAAMGILGLMVLVSGHASAASVTISTISAQAVIPASAGQVALFAQPRVLVSSTPAAGLTFTVTSLPVPTQGNWQTANQYIHLIATVTASGGVQIYTDNAQSRKQAGDPFPTEGYTGVNNPMGLVDNTSNAADPLPMVWRVADNIAAAIPAASSIGTLVAPDYISFGWFYFTDPGDVDSDGVGPDTGFIGFGQPYMRVITAGNTGGAGAVGGLWHFGTSPTEYGDRTSISDAVFVAAKFTAATAGRTYSAAIRVEAFTE